MVDIAVPKKLRAGDTLSFTEGLSDYPASTWTATLFLQNQATAEEFNATASGDDHVFSRTGAQTGEWDPGRYRWFVRVTDGTTVTTIDDGWIEIQPEPGDESYDHRSHARQMIDAIEAMLRKQATSNQLDLVSYNFGSVSVQRDRAFLEAQRDKYARELQREEGGDSVNRRHLKVRFGRP